MVRGRCSRWTCSPSWCCRLWGTRPSPQISVGGFVPAITVAARSYCGTYSGECALECVAIGFRFCILLAQSVG